MAVDIIYCGGGNPRFGHIAQAAGMMVGHRSGDTFHFPPAFLDLDWENLDLARHLSLAKEYRPKYVVAPDITEWPYPHWNYAEELLSYSGNVIVVPKVPAIIDEIPAAFVLGYSTPTAYSGTSLPFWEFIGRPIHILGGDPHRQMELFAYSPRDVVSVDCNVLNKMASTRCLAWMRHRGSDGHWHRLHWLLGRTEGVAPYIAFSISAFEVMEAWREFGA